MALAPTISEPMTRAEIYERYPNQRVCVVEMDYADPDDFEFRTARVVGHHRIPSEALKQAEPWLSRYQMIYHFRTGDLSPLLTPPRIVMTDEIRSLLQEQRLRRQSLGAESDRMFHDAGESEPPSASASSQSGHERSTQSAENLTHQTSGGPSR